MKQYDRYIPIDLPWMKSIPGDWKITKNKCIFEESKELVGEKSKEYSLLSLTLRGIIPRDIESGKGKFPQSFDKYKVVKQGDMAFCLFDMDETPRTVGLSNYNGMLTGAYDIYHVHDICPEYAYYYYLALDNIKALRFFYSGLRKTVSTPVFMAIKMPIPSAGEQEKIIQYLDWKTSAINKAISLTRKKIGVLNEQKRTIIDHIVTGKDVEDGDTKDAGIEGLQRVPSSWLVAPLKLFVKSNVETLSNKTEDDYEMDYIDISTVGYGFMKSDPVHYTFSEAPSRARRVVHCGDTIISTVRTYLRSICYIDQSLDGKIASTGFSVLTPNEKVVPELLNSILSANYFINAVVKNSVGTSYPAITDEKLLNLRIAIPLSIEEQKRLVKEIATRTASIETAIENQKKQITILTELRDRIMLDVVTGQVDVRDEIIPEYEKSESFEDEGFEDKAVDDIEED